MARPMLRSGPTHRYLIFRLGYTCIGTPPALWTCLKNPLTCIGTRIEDLIFLLSSVSSSISIQSHCYRLKQRSEWQCVNDGVCNTVSIELLSTELSSHACASWLDWRIKSLSLVHNISKNLQLTDVWIAWLDWLVFYDTLTLYKTICTTLPWG